MDALLVMTAARLVQCAPSEVLAARWRYGENSAADGLVVVWGIGWKRIFERAEVEALGLDDDFSATGTRAQMIEITPTNDVGGLSTLFPERLVKVLVRAGYATPGVVQAATDEELRDVNGVGPRTLTDIRELLPYPQQ